MRAEPLVLSRVKYRVMNLITYGRLLINKSALDIAHAVLRCLYLKVNGWVNKPLRLTGN